MDHIFFEFLLVLKVKGRRGNDIVECLDHLRDLPPRQSTLNPEAGG